MHYTWRTAKDGRILVRDGGGPVFVPSLNAASAEAALVDKVEARWGEACRRIGERHGLPDGWLQAHIQRESGGNPKARNPEKKPGREDDGVGLLQITAAGLKAGYSDAELENPETNLAIGAAYLQSLVRRYGLDFPRISAAFNAGRVRPPLPGFENPWGMHATPGHIDSEVRALNYYLERGMSAAARADLLSDDEKRELLASVTLASTAAVREDEDAEHGRGGGDDEKNA